MTDYQNVLFPYAYNILGSVEDSRDAIQDVILKYTAKKVKPENEKNYLIRGVINQSLNRKRNQKKIQSEEGWLPEPVSTDTSDLGLELNQMVSYSLMFLLERLNPRERAVFILKEAFAYTHDEIADVLAITTESSRKILSRATNKLKERRTTNKVSPVQFEIIDSFTDAIRRRDLDHLHSLLSDDISFHADGGGKIKVVKHHCFGVREVADLLIYVHHKYQTNYTTRPTHINHQPAILRYYRDKLISCQVFEFDNDNQKINRISIVLDPKKLKHLHFS